jgi:hypothetical protein
VRVIEERGRFVVPGLWDMHVHFRDPSRNLKMDIANGVLGIRNMGGAPKDAFPLREAIAGGYADRAEDLCLWFNCGWSGLLIESTIHNFSEDCRLGPSCRGIPKKQGSDSININGGPYLDRSGEKSNPDFPDTLLWNGR